MLLTATVTAGDMPDAIFVYEAKTRDGQPADRFRAVASVQQMLELPASREQRGGNAYYRINTAYFALRNPGDVADVIEAIKADVAQLIRGWLAKETFSVSNTINIDSTSLLPR